ncbi:hypothetical protein FND36_09490 [Lachnospiraceae bacterium KGMB03038]|nr:hypothetical protein FND36_09490 [Lachnospiraceae bacterium KGMB03038]
MMKIAGAVLVVGAAALMGMAKAGDIRSQYTQLLRLQRLICSLQGEMRYARSHLGEIFEMIGRREEEPYRTWLAGLAKEMGKRQRGTFPQIWSESIDASLGTSQLPDKEIQRLKSLGAQLGSADLELQIRTIDLYLEQLGGTIEEAREEMKTKVRLCHCLGVMSGMFVAVLLL